MTVCCLVFKFLSDSLQRHPIPPYTTNLYFMYNFSTDVSVEFIYLSSQREIQCLTPYNLLVNLKEFIILCFNINYECPDFKTNEHSDDQTQILSCQNQIILIKKQFDMFPTIPISQLLIAQQYVTMRKIKINTKKIFSTDGS